MMREIVDERRWEGRGPITALLSGGIGCVVVLGGVAVKEGDGKEGIGTDGQTLMVV